MTLSAGGSSPENHRFVFLLDSYYPQPLPNGICVHRVALALLRMGCDVHVIAYRFPGQTTAEEIEGVKVHRIRPGLHRRLKQIGTARPPGLVRKLSLRAARLVRWFQKLLLLPWFPSSSPASIYRFFRATLSIHRAKPLSCVISVFHPDETLRAGALIKRRIPDIPHGVYVLDSLIYLSGAQYIPYPLRKRLHWRFTQNVYDSADVVYNMECHRAHHDSSNYDGLRSKMEFLDIPLYEPATPQLTEALYPSEKTHLVYLGSLFQGFRQPDYLISLFRAAVYDDSYQLHFYSRGSCEETLAHAVEESRGAVSSHGFVGHAEVPNILANADILVNIGVSNSTAISSKIFEYMSTGKPVLHIYYLDDDVNLSYLASYPRSLSVQISDDPAHFRQDVTRMRDFLVAARSADPRVDQGLAAFERNTPEFTARRFLRLAEGRISGESD